jgi:hypothetical protein
MRPRFILIICIGFSLAYLAACFWPFRFSSPNNAVWLPESNGIQFVWQSIAYGDKEISLGKESVTIELWLMSRSEPDGKKHSILSLYDGTIPEDLVIAELNSELLILTPISSFLGRKNYRDYLSLASLQSGKPRFIAVTSSSGGTSVYVDGALAGTSREFVLQPKNLRGRLVLGSSVEGKDNWIGQL